MKELPKPYIMIHPILSMLIAIIPIFGWIWILFQIHETGRFAESAIDMANEVYQKINNKL